MFLKPVFTSKFLVGNNIFDSTFKTSIERQLLKLATEPMIEVLFSQQIQHSNWKNLTPLEVINYKSHRYNFNFSLHLCIFTAELTKIVVVDSEH